MKIIDLLYDYALKYFYPRKHLTHNNQTFKSSKDFYDEWLDSVYVNGVWYVCEDNLDEVLLTRNVNVEDIFYFYEEYGKKYIGLRVFDGYPNQEFTLEVVVSGKSVKYYYTLILDDDWSVVADCYKSTIIDSEISGLDVESVRVKSSEIIKSHIKYTGLNKIIDKNNRSILSKFQWDRLKDTSYLHGQFVTSVLSLSNGSVDGEDSHIKYANGVLSFI